MDFRRPSKTSDFLEDFYKKFRKVVDFLNEDEVMYEDINKSIQFLKDVKLLTKP
jgi:histidine ammonia-lyase